MIRTGLIACAVAAGLSLSAEARIQSTPEAVIDTVSSSAMSHLADNNLSENEANDLLSNVNVDAVSRFALGRYVRTASEAELESYNTAFRAYLADQLQTHLGNFAGGSFEIVDTVEREPGDVVVETSVTNADGEQLPVSWRVKSFDGDWQIIDVEFEGLWLVIEQRAQFQATLDANGGDVGALADSL